MKTKLLNLLIFITAALSAAEEETQAYHEVGNSVVTLKESGDGQVLHITGLKEEFEVELPWKEFGTFQRKGEGELRYSLQETGGYPVHYLVAYVTGPALKKFNYPYLVLAPPKGTNAVERMRKKVAKAMVEQLGGLTAKGYSVIVSNPIAATPAEQKILAHSYEYKALLISPEGEETQMHFRIYLTREGVYLVAAIGEGIYRYRANYQLPESCRFWSWLTLGWVRDKSRSAVCWLTGPKSMMEPLSGERYSSWWQRWITNPAYRAGTGAVDMMYWGRYHPDYVFERIKLNVAE